MDPHPSLRGLQAFEAAARNGSFASAARELSVSPAAISQLIRGLEEQIGRELFQRLNRRVVLTEAGQEVFPRLMAAFDALRNVSRELAGGESRPSLIVSVPPSMAMGWLPRRLGKFVSLHGAIDISLRGEPDPVPFEGERIDLRLSYGRFPYRDHETHEIVVDSVYPLCSPSFLGEHGPFDTPEALLRASHLIHTDWGPASAMYPSWWTWSDAQGLPPGRHLRHGLTVDSSRAALDLAESGLGIVLGQGIYAAESVEGGKLVVACDRPLPLNQPYCLTIPRDRMQRPVVTWFRDWLADECTTAVRSLQTASGSQSIELAISEH